MEQKKTRMKWNYNLNFISILAIVTFLLLAISPVSVLAQQSTDTRTIVDGLGNTVTIPNTINKIVIIQGACNVPSLLSAFSVGNKLIDGLCFKPPMQIKIQPEYANIDTVPAPNGEPNIENILKLKPDLVIGWTNLKNDQAMRDAGLPLVIINLSSYDSTVESTAMVANAVGVPDKGQKLLDSLNDTVKMITDKISGVSSDQRKKVLLLSSTSPLTVLGADSYNRDMIEKAGGICVTDNLPGYFLGINMETLLKLDPDIILVSSTSISSYQDLMRNSTWDSLRAKKDGKIYLAPTGVFYWDKPGAEMNLFLLWEANLFYPNLVTSDLLKDETKKFYKEFFSYDLSDGDYQTILNSTPASKA